MAAASSVVWPPSVVVLVSDPAGSGTDSLPRGRDVRTQSGRRTACSYSESRVAARLSGRNQAPWPVLSWAIAAAFASVRDERRVLVPSSPLLATDSSWLPAYWRR